MSFSTDSPTGRGLSLAPGLTRRAALAALCGAASGPLVAGTPAAPEFTDLFEAGQGGYALYRIPGLVVTRAGTLLCYCEARRHVGSDWDDIDLLLRRSRDRGRTFSAPQPLPRVTVELERNPVALERKQGQPEWRTYNNPTAIATRDGKVHLLFCVEYMRVFYTRSDDDGQTFSAPVEITAALLPLRSRYAWRAVATGPGHGLELRNGRLLVPVWIALGTEGNGHGPSVNTNALQRRPRPHLESGRPRCSRPRGVPQRQRNRAGGTLRRQRDDERAHGFAPQPAHRDRQSGRHFALV